MKRHEHTKSLPEHDYWRLQFHQMPVRGWLNDPNGVHQRDGVYHLYHQYVPATPHGGATHWAHKTSKDMVHFTEEAIFLSPDQPFDQDGAYSGSAFVKDHLTHFFYTGNVKKDGDYDYIFNGREQHTIHVTSDDGFNVRSRKVVIHHDEYPEGFTDHIRDPKVFEHTDGRYYMILGARTIDNRGAILTYVSDDLDEWEYFGIFDAGNDEEGYMWECPDTFSLNGKDVLIYSPQGILPTEYYYQLPFVAGYRIGKIDTETVKFNRHTSFHELDHGFDFYAPQTFEDESGRRIMWVWMGMGNTDPEYTNPTIARGWQHAMALPRELFIESNQLIQKPLPEYQTLRKNKKQRSLTELQKDTLKGEVYELLIELDKSPSEFRLELREDTVIQYINKELSLAFGPSGYGRRKRVIPLDHLEDLQIFSDTSSIEIFVNGGRHTFTSRVYPRPGMDKIIFDGDDLKGKVIYYNFSD